MENADKYLNSDEVPQVVKDAIVAHIAYDKADDALFEYFKPIVEEKLSKAQTKEDILNIKNSLRVIPSELCSKVLLFLKIIAKEKELGF